MQITFKGAVRALVLACAAGSLAACATITRGVHETWSVETDPSGAHVKTSNGFACDQTPCTFKMERKSEFDVTVTKDGYKPYSGHVTHSVSNGGAAGMAGNVLVGGIIGVGVDATSGAMMDLKPNPMKVKLEKDDGSAAKPAGQ
ncbi:MAG: PEGA domain-containing protein [Proteobacteria bacterium]|nr:PEGA domain-containing protein [Pseudomonadota bacterium]